MYTFKKVLAFALATLMICSCMVFTTLAADTPVAQATEGETIVPISTCETTDGFTAGGSTGVVDTTDPWAGNASLATTFTGVGGKEAGAIKYQFRGSSIFDATAMKTLVFDIWLSEATAFKSVNFEVELRGDGQTDDDEYRSTVTLTDISGTLLKDGWNHIEITIADMTKVGNPDMANWNYFRIYNKDEIGEAGKTYVFKLDNVYMTSREKDTAALGNVKIPVSGTFTGIAGNSASNYKNQFKNLGGIDISNMDALQFDIRITNAQANDINFGFLMTSSTDGDPHNDHKFQTGHTRPLKTLIGEEVPADGEWHTVSIPFALFTQTDASNADKLMNLKALNFFQVYNQKTSDALTETGDVEMRNFYCIKENVAREDLIWAARSQAQTADGTSNLVWFKDISQTGDYKADFSDIDGDGLNEWVLVNVEGDGSIHRQGGWTASGWLTGINSAVIFQPHVGYSNMTALKFDLYISDEFLIDKKLSVELCSAGKTDRSEICGSRTLRDWFGDDLKVGWNTVEMPLSKFNKATVGATGPFVPASLNYIRIMSDDTFDFTDGLAMAICNIYAVREVAEEQPAGTISVPGSLRVDDLSSVSATNAFMLKWVDANAPLDISRMDAVQFDVKVGHEDINYLSIGVHLSDTASWSDNIFRIGHDYTLESLAGGIVPADGEFHTVTVPLSLFTHAKGAANLSAINFLQIYNYKKDIGDTNAGFLNIENVRFVSFSTYDEVAIKSASLNLQDAFNIIYTGIVDKTMTSAGMLFEVTDAYGTVTRKQVIGQQGEDINELTFTYENIYPQNMTDNICTTLWALDNEGKLTMDKVSNYSVKEYCSNMLTGIADGTVEDNDGTLATLLCDTLAFGAALQTYIGYNTENLATDGVDMSAASANFVPPAGFPKLVGEKGDCPAEFFSASATLENICKLNITFKAEDVTGLKLNLAPNTSTDIIVLDTFEMTTVEDENGVAHDVYVVEIPIRPYELDTAYVITFEGYEDYMLIYSLGTYLLSQRNATIAALEAETDSAKIEELNVYKNLLESIVTYGTSARNYAVSQQ